MVFAGCSGVLHYGDARTGGPVLDVVRGHDHGALAGGLGVAPAVILLLRLHFRRGNWCLLRCEGVPRVLVDELMLLFVAVTCADYPVVVIDVTKHYLVVIFCIDLLRCFSVVLSLSSPSSLVVEGERSRK